MLPSFRINPAGGLHAPYDQVKEDSLVSGEIWHYIISSGWLGPPLMMKYSAPDLVLAISSNTLIPSSFRLALNRISIDELRLCPHLGPLQAYCL